MHITTGVEIFFFTIFIIPAILFWLGVIILLGAIGRTAFRIWRERFKEKMRIREWLRKEYGEEER